jgi:quercetin dioxygenase-like cupin family protein
MKVSGFRTFPNSFLVLALMLFPGTGAPARDQAEKFRNEKVLVAEQILAPGETLSVSNGRAAVLVYLNAGSVESVPYSAGVPWTNAVQRGEAMFQPSVNEPSARTIKNVGSTALHMITTTYLGNGGSETWSNTGLAPNYKLLFENQYGRVYDIRMAAGISEPRHSHHDRVVICLSGAELMHEMTDGRKEAATLKTGEIVWRPAVTHVGHNLGKTDLWVIAIEPK